MGANLKEKIKIRKEEMEACLEKTEAMDLEENLEEVESKSEHQGVPKGEVMVETIRELED
jgi:hypothetical protein